MTRIAGDVVSDEESDRDAELTSFVQPSTSSNVATVAQGHRVRGDSIGGLTNDDAYVLAIVNPTSGESVAAKYVMRSLRSTFGFERVFVLTAQVFSDPTALQKSIRSHAVRFFLSHEVKGNDSQEILGRRGTLFVSGGDGTISYVMEQLDAVREALEAEQRNFPVSDPRHGAVFVYPAVAVLPLGTGNDFSVCMGFGGGYVKHKVPCCIVNRIDDHVHKALIAPSTPFDRWVVQIVPLSAVWKQLNKKKAGACGQDAKSVVLNGASTHSTLPCGASDDSGTVRLWTEEELSVRIHSINWDEFHTSGDCQRLHFINYVSIGFDAYVLHKFSSFRSRHPTFCSTRWRNKLVYGAYSIKAALKCSTIRKYIPAICVPHPTRCVASSTYAGADYADDEAFCTSAVYRENRKPSYAALTIPAHSKALLVTNVNSYAAGTKPWGDGRGGLYRCKTDNCPMVITPVSVNDHKFEVQALGGLLDMGLLQLGMDGGACKIAQAREVIFFILCTPADFVYPRDDLCTDANTNGGDAPGKGNGVNKSGKKIKNPLRVQVDGEPVACITEPVVMRITELQRPRVHVRCMNPHVVRPTAHSDVGL
ncbi:Diacylglycerol kinase catalytic domain [Trypanosoma vivax]|uniref:Diacylglycerol kinase n=1 Tax=Trypanosoma vivax (strain Y486) TaxID=1055687 RepID=G0U1A8_TRYVY|nr:hypothetical protein TRVL_01584 [Trypanosoma vivax]KAH8608855.1 Diacylglycerol kinase catalytic domain [Trypanosoma vivax]CCC49863.1 conserved hypothetical protein [Trypanosoma vivax Y486]